MTICEKDILKNENDQIFLCSYGCGKKGIFELKNGKKCCSKSYNGCETLKLKNSIRCKKIWENKDSIFNSLSYRSKLSKSLKGKIRSKETINKWLIARKGWKFSEDKKNKLKEIHIERCKDIKVREKFKIQSKKFKRNINNLLEKHPLFFKYEEVRYNLEKLFDNILQVKCKECNKWFDVKPRQLENRLRSIEYPGKNGNSFFYCSEICKNNSRFYHQKGNNTPERKNKKNRYKIYEQKVRIYTEIEVKKYLDKIENMNLRGLLYHLDHKYSIYDGFKNNIDPKIISCWRNLQIISKDDNLIKKSKSCIKLEQLIEETNRNII